MRDARGLLRLDDGVLSARGAAGGLGRSEQSACSLLRAYTEGRGGRRRHQDRRKLALGERRGQRHLAYSLRTHSRQGRSADARVVPRSGPRCHRRSRKLERLWLAGHRLQDGRDHRSQIRTAASCAADQRDLFGEGAGAEVPGNDQARFGYPTFGPTALVAPIVGMAQGALDAFTETARGAKRMARPGVFEKVAESP